MSAILAEALSTNYAKLQETGNLDDKLERLPSGLQDDKRIGVRRGLERARSAR